MRLQRLLFAFLFFAVATASAYNLLVDIDDGATNASPIGLGLGQIVGQNFTVANTSEVSIISAYIHDIEDGATGCNGVELTLETCTNGSPSGTLIDPDAWATIATGSISTAAFNNFTLASSQILTAGIEYCIQLGVNTSNRHCDTASDKIRLLFYTVGGDIYSEGVMSYSADAGGAWTMPDASWDCRLLVWGATSELINIHAPAHESKHYNASVPFKFHYNTQNNSECGYWLNGSLTWLGVQANNTNITGTLTASEGGNNFTVFCGDGDGGNATAKHYFDVETTYSYRAYNLDTGAQIENFTITFYNGTNTTSYTASEQWLNKSNSGLPTGEVTLQFSAEGFNTTNFTRYINFSAVDYYNAPLQPAGIIIRAYDEQTLQRIYFDLDIFNATNSMNWSNQYAFNESVYNITTGEITIDVSNSSYYGRRYFATILESTVYELDAYLLNTSSPVIGVTFHIRNLLNTPIEGATVNIIRQVGGAGKIVGQQTTDAAGDAFFFMELNAPYTIQILHPSYMTFYQSINPSSNDYTITLGEYDDYEGLPISIFDDVSWYLTPATLSYAANSTQNITLIVASSNSSLQYFGLAIYYANGSTAFTQNVTGSPAGGLIHYDFNTTGLEGDNFTVGYWFKRNPDFFGNRTYWSYTWNTTIKSLEEFREEFGELGLHPITYMVISLLIALFLGAWVYRMNSLAGIITILGVLSFTASWGWLSVTSDLLGGGGEISSWGLLGITTLTVISVIYLKERW